MDKRQGVRPTVCAYESRATIKTETLRIRGLEVAKKHCPVRHTARSREGNGAEYSLVGAKAPCRCSTVHQKSFHLA